MPLTLGVQELSLVAGNIGALFYTHCKRLFVSFQNPDFEVIFKRFVLCFSSVCVFKMFVESGLLPHFGSFAVEFRYMLLCSAVTVLP